MGDTIFHKIVSREIPADIVFEDDRVIAFRDISPAAPSHVLVVPKVDIPTLNDISEEHESVLGHMVIVSQKIAQSEGLADDGYRLVVNCGEHGGQVVMQLHMHVLGKRQLAWPPG
jgi:histidine triad (HIT) family protein